jgi:SH3-like domain-containing protein
MKTALMFLCLSLLSRSALAEALPVTVVGDRVNLRNLPGLESDVVGAVNYGETLQALEKQGEWVRVRPPAEFVVWVFSPLLFEDKEVRSPVLNMRAGPGTNHSSLGQLKRGDAVEVLEVRDEWRRIRATDAVTLWINQSFLQGMENWSEAESVVQPVPEPTPVPTPLPTPPPTPEPVVEIRTIERIIEVPVVPTPTPTVVPPEDLRLVPLSGQGTASVRRGYVKSYLLAGNSPSRFLLVQLESDRSEKSLAYLRGNDEVLRALSGKHVLVKGRDFWVTGQRLPVTQVESTEALEEAP